MVFQYIFAQFLILFGYQMQNHGILGGHYQCNKFQIPSHYSRVSQSKYFLFHLIYIMIFFISFSNEYPIFCTLNEEMVFPILSLQQSIFFFCIPFNCFLDYHARSAKFGEFLCLFYLAKGQMEDLRNFVQGIQFKKIKTTTAMFFH